MRVLRTQNNGPFRGRGAARRGMAMVGTMLMLMCLMALMLLGLMAGQGGRGGGSGLVTATGNAMTTVQQQAWSAAAFNVAESGVEYGIQWMHNQLPPPLPTKACALPGWTGTLGTSAGRTYSLSSATQTGSFTVTIYPDAGNATATYNGVALRYLIESFGTCNGITRGIRALVAVSSFGQYAFFSDSDPSNITWVAGQHSFDGPVHFNGTPDAQGNARNPNIIWQDNQPLFHYRDTNAFTYSAGVNWYYKNSSGQYQVRGPQSLPEYQSVADVGQTGVHQSPSIAMPAASLKQQYAALGQNYTDGSTTPPASVPDANTPTGVTAPAGGGVYVHCKSGANDVQQMTLSVSNGNQIVDVVQPADDGSLLATRVTMTASGTTVTSAEFPTGSTPNLNTFSGATTSPATTTTSGKSNGMVYCDGNIGQSVDHNTAGQGLSGTVADHLGLTIATDTSHNVCLDGSVTYQTPRQMDGSGHFLSEDDPANATFKQNAGQLGIVTSTVELSDNKADGSAQGDIELDGTVMAYTTLTARDYAPTAPGANGWVRPTHFFYCMGGEITKNRGALGTFNTGNLQVISGLTGRYTYDPRLSSTPPPYFPTTRNTYSVLSWQRIQ